MKKSIKEIKLKLKKKKKKGHFISFYDRIKEINEKEKLEEYNILNDNKYDDYLKSYKINNESYNIEDLKNTNFYTALCEYPKNCYNNDFKKCCTELLKYSKNLMVILLNKDKIFSTLLKYIQNTKIENDEYYFYKLLVILIKDLKNESKKYIEQILKILYDKINFNNLDLLEEIFNTYANIFRIMNKTIIKNIEKYLKLSLPLLCHRNNIIKIFIADSFSYLLRKLSLHDLILCFHKIYSFFNIVKKNKLKDYSETVSLLMLEALKVDNEKLSKKTLPFLKYIIYAIFLKETYYCDETNCYYEHIDIKDFYFIEKSIFTFFVDIYNFMKKGTFEFIEIFLTFILKNYSLLFNKYYSDILFSFKDTDNLNSITNESYGYIFNNLTLSNLNEIIYTNYNDQFDIYDKEQNEIKNINLDNSRKLNNNENEISKDINFPNFLDSIIFIKDKFYVSTNFFLKKILNIWLEKNNEKKSIIMETCLSELSKYTQNINNLKLNYVSFFFIWNLYDHAFFLLNHYSKCNENINNIYISLVENFMFVLKEDNSSDNIFYKYLLCFFVLKIDEILNKKNVNNNNICFQIFLKFLYLNIVKNHEYINTYLYEKESYVTNTTINSDKKNLKEEIEEQILDKNILRGFEKAKYQKKKFNSFLNNMYLCKLFTLYDVIKNTQKKGNIDNDIIITEKSYNEIHKKNNNTDDKNNCNINDKNETISYRNIYNYNDNFMLLEVEKDLENLHIFIFDQIKKLHIILKNIIDNINYGIDINIINTINKEKLIYIRMIILFLFAFVNLLAEINNKNTMLLTKCSKENYSILHSICEDLEKLKYSNFLLSQYIENKNCKIKIYINSIILDINNMIILSANAYNNVDEDILSINTTFLISFLNKLDKQDIYFVNFLKKLKNVITNLYESNYFKDKINNIFLYLKFLKKIMLYYDTICRKELLKLIKLLVSIYIELKSNKINLDNSEEININRLYEKVLYIFDCLIYLETEQYLPTYEKIYNSKIIDIMNYFDTLKNFNFLSEYIFKISTKIFINELIMLLNASLITIPKSIIFSLKNFFLSCNIPKKIIEKGDYFSEYYFYILKNIFKVGKKKLQTIEELIEEKEKQNNESLKYSDSENNIIQYYENENRCNLYVNYFKDNESNIYNQNNSVFLKESLNENNGNDNNINNNNNDDNKCTYDIKNKILIENKNLKNIVSLNIKMYEEKLQNCLNKKENKSLISLTVKELDIENSLKNILSLFDLLISPLINAVSETFKMKILNIYIWIVTYINTKCNNYINKLKYYKLINILFDISYNMNNVFLNHRDNAYNKKNLQSSNSNSYLIDQIKLLIKLFISKFIYNMHILRIPNILKFINILCTYNEKLNNYKNDIEEILSEKNINFTKLLLNIKEEDTDFITPFLIKIIFCLLKNGMKKGSYKLKKNMIFYLSNISYSNYCYIFISSIYSFINVYKNKIDYNNLLRYNDKEQVLINFLNDCKGNFCNYWNFVYDKKNINIKNDSGNSFLYENIFNHSYWYFNGYIIEIKKDALFKNFVFKKNFNLLIEILKIMKYKLNNYFEFFFHIFITISYYINSYYYLKKKLKLKELFLTIRHTDNDKDKYNYDHFQNDLSLSNSNNNNNDNAILNFVKIWDDKNNSKIVKNVCLTNTKIIELNIKDKYLKNIHKKCIESIQFIMLNYENIKFNLLKVKEFFTFLFYKNIRSVGKKNLFLNILFNIWCKNEAYYDFYNTIIPNSILMLIKVINNKNIIKKLSDNEWSNMTDKVFNIILRLCGYDDNNELFKRKTYKKSHVLNNKKNISLILSDEKKNSELRILTGIRILKPYISDIILCIKKVIFKRYKDFLHNKNGLILNKKKMNEISVINNKELHILIELSSINKNQINNIHIINLIITFVLINKKSLHCNNPDYINKIKLILIAIKKLIINISKHEYTIIKRRKNNFNFSCCNNLFTKNAQLSEMKDKEKKITNNNMSFSSCFYYSSLKYRICLKLKTMLYEIIQRCYDLSCRVLAGKLLIMIGCVLLKIRNIKKYLEIFKKNVNLFLKRTNSLNYNSKNVLKHIIKIPLKSEKIQKSKYYSFLQIAQIYYSLNIFNTESLYEQYDSDVQFLIMLDLCNIKLSSNIIYYLQKNGENAKGNELSNESIKDNIYFSKLSYKGESKENEKKYKIKKFTSEYLFLNSNKIFFEILIRHCLFLIFNEQTNEMVRDKSINFILFFTELLKYLLESYEKKKGYDSMIIDIKICIYFVINIIIPKALNALKRNINDFTKNSMYIILTSSKNICPYMEILKSLKIDTFLNDIKISYTKNNILNESINPIFSFNIIKIENEKENYNIKKEGMKNFKVLEKLLFYDLYDNMVVQNNSNNKCLHKKKKLNDKDDTIIENIIDLKSENNSEGIKKLATVTPHLSFYTIHKIVIPLSLNYIFQTNSKKETYDKILSLNSIKLLGMCTEKVYIKNIYNLLSLLLFELKKNSFNKIYIEKTISHIVRKYNFREFQDLESEYNINFQQIVNRKKRTKNPNEIRDAKNEDGVTGENINNENDNIENESEKETSLCETQIKNKEKNIEKINEKKRINSFCDKFIQNIIPQLRSLMFDKKLINEKKKKKSYINDLVVDSRNLDVIAKPDIILSYLVILNKIDYNFQKELHKIIYKLCYCLSSKLNIIRSESKKTLCFISMYLGLNYFDLIIKQMSDYLTKGYHIPIFLCTVNSILESVLYEKEKFLDKNYLKINFNILKEGNLKNEKKKLEHNNKIKKIKMEDETQYDDFCLKIFSMIKLEIINEIEKNTEDVNKKKIKRKTKESKKTYGSNIIKLLTNIVSEYCIENNILIFLESLFSGESFADNEVDRNFIFKKKYIFIIASYFNDFIKGLKENKNLTSSFILNIIYKLLIKSVYFFKGDTYENLLAVMKNSDLLLFKYQMLNDINNFNSFKKNLHFLVSTEISQHKYLGYNYEYKFIEYPQKKSNLNIIEGSFQEKSIYDSINKTKKYDFKVHAEVLAKMSLKLLLFIIKKTNEFFFKEKDKSNINSTKIDVNLGNINYQINSNTNKNTNELLNCNQENITNDNLIMNTVNIKKSEDTLNDNSGKRDVSPLTNKNDIEKKDDFSVFVNFIHLIEPLLVYCYCYGKGDVFILSSKCIKNIKGKKFADFRNFGKLVILSSIDILKNIPNYYSKEFDKLILSCIDTLIYLIKNNNKNDIMSWLNSVVSNDTYNNSNNNIPNNKRKIEKSNMNKVKNLKRQKKLNYLLDENTFSTYYNDNDDDELHEEYAYSLRYCLINQISLLLESKNHIWELLVLFKNCILREDINNIIKDGVIFLKINSCIDQIFTIMIEESHNLKLSFLCGQIYIDFLMRFPLSKKEKRKKFFVILNNLNDENEDSRIAILNSIYIFLNRSNSKLLKEEFYFTTFASLLTNFSNESDSKCKKMYVFLISLLFQQVNDLNYVFNSYKILKDNLSFNTKASFAYTYLYLLPVFTSFFYKKIPSYHKIILNEISSRKNEQNISKNYQKDIKDKITQICLGEKNCKKYIEENGKVFLQEDSKNCFDIIRNHFVCELLNYCNNKNKKNNLNEEKKKKKNPNKNELDLVQDKITFMHNQLEDLFLLLMTHLMNKYFLNIKTIMQEDKNIINIFTSIENITYFCNNYDMYTEMDKDIVYLFYKSLEQIFFYLDIHLIEKLLPEKYVHEKYKSFFFKINQITYSEENSINRNICTEKISEKDNIIHNEKVNENNKLISSNKNYEKLIIYFLYFWTLIFENGLFNKNPYIQIISIKIVLNYINKKMKFTFFPLLLVKLFSSPKFIINIIIKKLLSLLLNSYFLEHFYIYYKEVSFLLSEICKILIYFPWITNGYEENQNEKDNKCFIHNDIKFCHSIKLSSEVNSTELLDYQGKNCIENNLLKTSLLQDDNISSKIENKELYNSSDDEEYRKVNIILQNEENTKAITNICDYQKNQNIIVENIKITKEILSYSKFFLIIVTLSRAINLHLKNKKKAFTRILTILNTYKNIISDFPEELWNSENGIINNVIMPLYKIASISKKKDFVENENIFQDNTYKKFLYLSSFSWDIISLLEKKLQNKGDVFNKAFIQIRQRINRIRFIRKKMKNILAIKNPQLYTLRKLKKREKLKLEKKKRKMNL
ncbi:conserved Plasmodium protein, unknown function [Plasmodium relictum]|uniref:U3 small nucleolar RNA-associated protein 20 domain-containing protein n=1 Tax=Plasmodium relictum TaxID=85471 RepID=A0A1J1H6W4_PLARL|nr:conserved Plasmodium protein, unknown function [Plasmodium relictum]CRH00657.1 conserved Plasmodium protein, unknown function [Plasmodium relictum]